MKHCWHFEDRPIPTHPAQFLQFCCFCGKKRTITFEKLQKAEGHGKYLHENFEYTMVQNKDFPFENEECPKRQAVTISISNHNGKTVKFEGESVSKGKKDVPKVMPNPLTTHITAHDVGSFVEKKLQRWESFKTELLVTEEGGRNFDAEITGQDAVGGSMVIKIMGSKGVPISVSVDYKSENGQLKDATLRDLSEAMERVTRWADVLKEFAKLCEYVKSLAFESEWKKIERKEVI